jgi:hypothetical protein
VHPVHAFATVFASSLQYQVLETSAWFGETIQATPISFLIIIPPKSGVFPTPKFAAVGPGERKN